MQNVAEAVDEHGVTTPRAATFSHALFAVLAGTVAVVVATAGREVGMLIATVATGAVVGRQVLSRRLRERAWVPVLAGIAILFVDAVSTVAQVTIGGHDSATGPVPTIAIPLGYLALLVGAVMLISPRGRRNTGALLDAALVSVTCTVVLWNVLLQPHLAAIDAGVSRTCGAVLVFLFLGGIIGALTRTWMSGRRHGALGYVLLAIVAAYLGSLARMLTWTSTESASAWWVGFIWAVAYAALAAASVHPSANTVVAPSVDDRLTPRRIAWQGVALLAAPVVACVEDVTNHPVDGVLLAATTLVVVPLVLARVNLLARLHIRAEERLRHLAQHDELTGVANRRAAAARLQVTLDRVAAGRSNGAVVAFADLDEFKSINDELGHPVGDRVLAEIAARLRAHLRGEDTVGRFGGDEFVIICEGDPARLEGRVRDLVAAALKDPVDVDGVLLTCRASVGTVVVRPGEVVSADEVLSAADTRMYEQKGRPSRTR